MKNFTFQLDVNQAEWVFKPIRTKLDVINILMRVIKIMLSYQIPAKTQIAGHFNLSVDVMSRLFFVSQKKFYSINFPFLVSGELGNFRFYNHHHQDINSKSTSSILGFINEDGIFDEPDVLDFAVPVVGASSDDIDLWALLRELLLWEEGYIRYDDDPVHDNGDLHPRYHLDVFYSSAATFKLGFRKSIEHVAFADILDVNTNCRFFAPK